MYYISVFCIFACKLYFVTKMSFAFTDPYYTNPLYKIHKHTYKMYLFVIKSFLFLFSVCFSARQIEDLCMN